MSAYGYGPDGPAWTSFSTEQQGSIVDEWFAGLDNPDKRGRQKAYAPMDSNDTGPNQNPYYRYVRDHIRAGIA